MNVLNDLLRIKKFREEKAQMALAHAKTILHESEMALDRAVKNLKDHIIESKRKEESLFSDLYIRLVRLKDIDSVSLDMALIKEETNKLEIKITEAKESLKLAKDAAEHAKIMHSEAVSMCEKFSELVELNNIEKIFESQMLEDIELEEAGSSRYSRANIERNNNHTNVSI